jgi:hypothetical protein
MTEEFDALRGLDLSQALLLVAGLLAFGIALEVLLRLAGRWAVSKNRRLAGVILHIYAYDLTTGALERVTHGNRDARYPDWRPRPAIEALRHQ